LELRFALFQIISIGKARLCRGGAVVPKDTHACDGEGAATDEVDAREREGNTWGVSRRGTEPDVRRRGGDE
jgi:hypothetical protein